MGARLENLNLVSIKHKLLTLVRNLEHETKSSSNIAAIR